MNFSTIALVAALTVPVSALAATQTFDFTNATLPNGNVSSFVQPLDVTADNGLEGELSAHNTRAATGAVIMNVNADGAGVGYIIQDGEALRLVLDTESTLTAFAAWEQGGSFSDSLKLFVDDAESGTFVGDPDTTTTFSGLSFTGTKFEFVGFDDPNIFESVAYRIASATFEDSAIVPLPAGAPLLIGGLAAFALVRSRRG